MKIENLDMEALEALALQLHDERADFLQSLVDIRKQGGLTQREVAERMGVTQPTVSEFEHYDANPTLDTVLRYALAVDACLHMRAYEAKAFRNDTWSQISRADVTTLEITTTSSPRHAWSRAVAA